jgi:hypothetical protein
MQVQFLTFEEWLREHPELADAPCEECEGNGEVECPHCGNLTTCHQCGGSGKDPRRLYREQRERDERNLKTWPSAANPVPAQPPVSTDPLRSMH